MMTFLTLGWFFLLLCSATMGIYNEDCNFSSCTSDLLVPEDIHLICVLHFHNIDMEKDAMQFS